MEPILLFTVLLLGIGSGILGALFGIGGGLIIVPAMILLYGMNATDAAAISLVGIVAASVGGTVFYLDHKVTNIRLGLFLEISTVIGAILGVIVSGILQEWVILIIFTVIIFLSAVRMFTELKTEIPETEDGEFSYMDLKEGKEKRYDLKRKWPGFALCTGAGVISSLTGVGGGVIKVPIMNSLMGVPIKAATATSSYMIGITAFSGAIMYFLKGNIVYDVAGFLAVGTFIGAAIGSLLSKKIDASSMKKYFSILIFIITVFMIIKIGGMV